MPRDTIQIGTRQSAKDIAQAVGMNEVNSSMAVPYLWFTPAATDGYSPVIIMMVEAIQHRLGQLGYATRGDGFVDAATVSALRQIAGRRWKNQPWVYVMQAVLAAAPASKGASAMGEYLSEPTAGGRYGSLGDFVYELPLSEPTAGGRYGSLGAADSAWCSDMNVQSGCTPLRGICKPMDAATLDLIKQLQRLANRFQKAAGKSLIDVDGRIGPQTVRAVEAALGADYFSCDDLMSKIEGEIAKLATRSMARGLPAVADPKPKAPPSMPGPGGTVVHPPDDQIRRAGFVGTLTSPMGLAAIGVGALIFLAWRDSQKKPRRKTRRRRRR